MAKGIPLRVPKKVPVSKLCFDVENPRFASEQGPKKKLKDEEIIRHLLDTADLGELIQSIAASGYIDIEPLIGLFEKDKYLVLEGNRRLAAIKVLTDPSLAMKIEIRVPTLPPEIAKTLKEVSVYRVAARDDARNFIGFKHINGPHRWDSLAKARFAADWFKRESANGVTLKDIARKMGDRHDTIQRMVAGVYVLDQSKKEKLFDLDDRYSGRSFAFSHLYTALTRPGYREYLGLPPEWREQDPEPDPIPQSHLPNLKQLMMWLYGSKLDDIKPVVTSQNPDVKHLGEVLANAKARTLMLGNQDLAAAYAEVETPSLQFERNLVDAHRQTENAFKKVRAYSGEDVTLLEVGRELQQNANLLLGVMEKKAGQVPKK
ncbi:MAG TPA: hypothetical protein VLC06_10615 [Polyangia bacterium]|jgi:hypothetical protein|nr:hypothetical protein [Polyangia bacterium]